MGLGVKKAMKKAMKKGKGRAPKPVELGPDGEPLPKPEKPAAAPKGGVRKRVLSEIGELPIQQAISMFQGKLKSAKEAVKDGESKEKQMSEEVAKAKAKAEAISKQIEELLQQNKLARENVHQAKLGLMDVEKKSVLLRKAEQAAQSELRILENEVENEDKRIELREAKRMAKEASMAAVEARRTEKEAMKEAKKREEEAARRARAEEAEAKRQALDLKKTAKEKMLQHKRLEKEEKLAALAERKAASGKGAPKKPKRIVEGEDVD